MDNSLALQRRVFRYALWLMLLSALVGFVLPAFRPYAVGIILGLFVGVLNAWLLEKRVEKVVLKVLGSGRRYVSLGFATRVVIVLIATMFAYWQLDVDFIGMAGGLAFVPLANVVVGIVTGMRHN